MKKLIFLTASMLFLTINLCYSQIDWKNVFGKDIKKYTIYSYPTNNYGVGTSCAPKWNAIMLSDMVQTFHLDTVKKNLTLWYNLNDNVFPPGQGPRLNVTDTTSQKFGVNLIIPKLLSILNITVNPSYNNSKGYKVTIDSAYIRNIKIDNFKNFITSQPQTSELYKAYQKNKLLIVTSDIVLCGYKLEINRKDSLGGGISVKLDSLAKTSTLTLGGSSLSFNINKNGSGNYVISSSKPLILGVLIEKQKNILTQSASNTLELEPIGPDESYDLSLMTYNEFLK